MTDAILAAYEAVPYDSKAIALTDPDAIAAIGILHGITPAPADRCRVLELGCGSAANLVSMAFRFPKSRFVGIDLAPSQIAAGRLAVSEMGLQNIELDARSITDFDASLGTFDYIICHGVYSWVPPEVQDAILRVCGAHLAPNGIVYMSYNALPGWHRRGMLRDMLLFHDDPNAEPADRVARARDLAGRLGAAIAGDATPHAAVLREELSRLAKSGDTDLFHEQLERFNTPVYFSELVRRAEAHGLQYLTEAAPSAISGETKRAAEALARGRSGVEREQYIDFATGRGFRRTLLCRAGVEVSSAPIAEAVERLFVRSRATSVPPSEADAARGPGVESFREPDGAILTTNHPLVIATLHVLMSHAPAVMSFADLRAQIATRLESADEDTRRLADDPRRLADTLLECATASLVAFRSMPSKFVSTAGARPKASGLARWQSLYSNRVSSLGHWPVEISGMERFILPLLDGSNDRAQLVRHIERAFQSGDLELPSGIPTREQIDDVLNDVLVRLGSASLLSA